MTVLADFNNAGTGWELIYTAPENTKIGAFTCTNVVGINASIKVAISDGSPDDSNSLIQNQIVVRNQAWPGWEVVGHTIPKNSGLYVQSSQVGVHFYVSD